MKSTNMYYAAAVLAVLVESLVPAIAQEGNFDNNANAATTTTVTGVTGTITQVNYRPNGTPEGFLIGTNVLLSFPNGVCGGLSTLGVVGNSITYSGTAQTTSTGFEAVRATSFTNNTTRAAFTAATPTSSAYGPTAGVVKQLNYGYDGSIDGFLFTPGGSTTALFVSTGSRASATLKPLLTVGASVSVTGTTSTNLNACSVTGELTTVDASSLTVAGQTIVIAGGGGFRGHR